MLKKIINKNAVLFFFALFVIVSCTDSNSEQSKYEGKESKRIALVTDSVVANAAFLSQAVEALAVMQSTYGFEARHVVAKDTFEWADNVKNLAEQGYDLIIGVGWQAAELFPIVRDNFRDVKFAVIDVEVSDERIKSMTFNMAEGAYILGVMIATAFPEEKRFGYIGNFNDAVDFRYRYGFEQGVLSVLPESEVLFEYVNSYNNADAVYDKAMQFFVEDGIRFVAGMVSTQANLGLFKAVLELHEQGTEVYASGVGIDQTTPQNPNIIAGLTKDTGVATTYIIKEFLDDKFQVGVQMLNFNTGGFNVLHVTDRNVIHHNKNIITLNVISTGKKVISDIVEGKLNIVVPEKFR